VEKSSYVIYDPRFLRYIAGICIFVQHQAIVELSIQSSDGSW
jgi:hypothetical protein